MSNDKCQMSLLRYQMSTSRCKLSLSTVKFQLSNFNCQMSTVKCQMSNNGKCQMSTGQKSGNNFHFFRHILSCTAKTTNHWVKNYILQFKYTPGPSFCQQTIFYKLNIFVIYHQLKVQK